MICIFFRTHLKDLNRSLITGLNRIGDNSSDENGITCPICSSVSSSVPMLQQHSKSCKEKVNAFIEKLDSNGQVNFGVKNGASHDQMPSQPEKLACEICGAKFKLKIQQKLHKSKCPGSKKEEVKSKDVKENIAILGFPQDVVTALFKCLVCSLPFDSEEKLKKHQCVLKQNEQPAEDGLRKALSCLLCPADFNMSFFQMENLKRHYALAHYQIFFSRYHTQKFPSQCSKASCSREIRDLRDLSLHYGMDHRKLKKALEKEKKTDMAETIQMLFSGEDGSQTSDSLKSPSFKSGRSSIDENIAPPAMMAASPPRATVTSGSFDANLLPPNVPKRVPHLGFKGQTCPKCDKVIMNENLAAHLTTHYQ